MKDDVATSLKSGSKEIHLTVAGRALLRALPSLCISGDDGGSLRAWPMLCRSAIVGAVPLQPVAARPRAHIKDDGLYGTGVYLEHEIYKIDVKMTGRGSAFSSLVKCAAGCLSCSEDYGAYSDKHDSFVGAEKAVRSSSASLAYASSSKALFDEHYLHAKQDLEHATSLSDARETFLLPLWEEATSPHFSTVYVNSILGFWQRTPATSLFWSEWYKGYLEGNPLDWELQRRVALIGNAFWDNGPDAVAEEINRIRARFDLEKRIEELETELHRATVGRHGIGGNMPPEPLDGEPIAQELIIVWQPLEELRDEIAKTEPDPMRLRKIVFALVEALEKGFAWCLEKGDLIVDTAIKWAVPAVGTGYLALNADKLEAVIEAVKKLLGVH